MFFDHLRTVLRTPDIGLEFIRYQLGKLMPAGPIRTLPGQIEVTGFSGFSEYHSCANFIGPAELAFLSNCPKSDGAVIDVGANLGVVSIILARHFADRTVHAFEHNPSTYIALRGNLQRNRCFNVVPHDLAVAGHDGLVTFEANPRDRATTSISAGSGPHATSVSCITLDSFAQQQELERIAFLKVDVEGYERLIFQGGSGLIGSCRIAMIFFEVCPALAIRAGFAPEESASFLAQRDYRLCRMDERGRLQPAQLSDVSSVTLENWIALRP